jgi:hypothetical protein
VLSVSVIEKQASSHADLNNYSIDEEGAISSLIRVHEDKKED